MAMGVDTYPGLRLGAYGIMHRGPSGRLIMHPASSYWMGLLETWDVKRKRQALEKWQAFRRQHDWANGYFEIPWEQRVHTKERTESGRWRKKKRNLQDLSRSELEHAIIHGLRAKSSRRHKAAHLWKVGGDARFRLDSERRDHHPFAGTAHATAQVHSNSSAINADVTKFRHVSITDLFGEEPHWITDCSFPTEHAFWTQLKQGRAELRIVTPHHAAVMYLARERPEAFREYTTARGVAVLPVDLTAQHQHGRLREPQRFLGLGPDPDVLVIDALINRIFAPTNGQTLAEISRKLHRIPQKTHPMVGTALIDGVASFDVLPLGYAKPFNGDGSPTTRARRRALRDMYSSIHASLADAGYQLQGHTLEYVGTDYQTVAYNFVNKEDPDKQMRVLFSPDYVHPPLILFKKLLQTRDAQDPNGDKNPIAYVGRKASVELDDHTRRDAEVEVYIPNVYIPDALKDDYKAMIAHEYVDDTPANALTIFRRVVQSRFMGNGERSEEYGGKLLWLVK